MKKVIIVLVVCCLGLFCSAQTLTLSSGIVRSSTVWRMAKLASVTTVGMNFYKIPKTDISVSIGLEYFEKEKWSMSSYLSYYQSGGKLAINERKESNPEFR